MEVDNLFILETNKNPVLVFADKIYIRYLYRVIEDCNSACRLRNFPDKEKEFHSIFGNHILQDQLKFRNELIMTNAFYSSVLKTLVTQKMSSAGKGCGRLLASRCTTK
uniref:Uncharacterized protein n=1 Tax=Megaselia scalaris TaxID=36166 RepID=T1GL05_MEGSC